MAYEKSLSQNDTSKKGEITLFNFTWLNGKLFEYFLIEFMCH